MVGFIKFLLESIDEIRVEMIIIVFTLIGFTLRKNEPGLLKEMINSASEACKKCEITSTRMKFMIETLTDIKNKPKVLLVPHISWKEIPAAATSGQPPSWRTVYYG